jgi:threonyl-tRNA synthetase
MKEIKIVLPDGSKRAYPEGVTVKEVVSSLDPRVLAVTVAARFNRGLIDMNRSLTEDGTLELVDVASREGLEILRHSISHVMAQAVQDIFPGVLVSIGPAIEDGFYYDFEYDNTFTLEDLEKIEARMQEIIKEDLPFMREEVSRGEAISFFQGKGESYKVELLKDLPEEVKTVSLYRQGGYTDLCRGPHVPSTAMIRAFKLLNVAGAYWRGDERNKMLQRIYGTGFATRKDLEEYLRIIEEAKNGTTASWEGISIFSWSARRREPG